MPSQQLAKSYRRKYKKLMDQFTLATARQHHLILQVTTRAQAALKLQAELDFLLDVLLDGKAIDLSTVKEAGVHADWVKEVLASEAAANADKAAAEKAGLTNPALQAAAAAAAAASSTAASASESASAAKSEEAKSYNAGLGITTQPVSDSARPPESAGGPSQILLDLAAAARTMLKASREKELSAQYWHQPQPPHLADLPWDLDLESKSGSYVEDVQAQMARLKKERATAAAMMERMDDPSPAVGSAAKRRQSGTLGKKRGAMDDEDDFGKRKKKRRPGA